MTKHINPVLFEVLSGEGGDIGLVTLNRPAVLNALNEEMCVILYEQLRFWERESHIKAVIIKSISPQFFCAGGDVRQLYDWGKQEEFEAISQFFNVEYRLNQLIAHYPKPYIALMSGINMGGGLGLSVHGQYRIATENLKMAMPETQIGFFPDIGGTYFLSRCPFEMGTYLALTGATINAREAQFMGLVDYIVPSDQIESLLQALVSTPFTAEDHLDLISCIQSFHLTIEKPPIYYQRDLIEAIFSRDDLRMMVKLLKEQPQEWYQGLVGALEKKSPMSLKVTLAALRRGVNLSLVDCQFMEKKLTEHFIRFPDFYEGIRARLIDKDNQPQWQPSTLEAVTPGMVEAFFI